jgi:hypothetical protein
VPASFLLSRPAWPASAPPSPPDRPHGRRRNNPPARPWKQKSGPLVPQVGTPRPHDLFAGGPRPRSGCVGRLRTAGLQCGGRPIHRHP